MMKSIRVWWKELWTRKTWCVGVDYHHNVETIVVGYWKNGIYYVKKAYQITPESTAKEIEEVSKVLHDDKIKHFCYEGSNGRW